MGKRLTIHFTCMMRHLVTTFAINLLFYGADYIEPLFYGIPWLLAMFSRVGGVPSEILTYAIAMNL